MKIKKECEITVYTHRCDLIDDDKRINLQDFKQKYPNIKVNIISLKNYEDEIKRILYTKQYGDVLMIPGINKYELNDYFIELGMVEELNKRYYKVEDKSLNGIVYGIPTMLTIPGVVYNRKVFRQAGIADNPRTPQEFVDALVKIKRNTEAIPCYTNYADNWALKQWECNRLAYGDPGYVNAMTRMDHPFYKGSVHYEIYKLLYDIVKNKLVEDDTKNTKWENSKQMLADGKLATMILGSWAISQIRELSKQPEDICFMPFPITAKDGRQYIEMFSDYHMGVSKFSKHISEAKLFLFWFINYSSYCESQDAMSANRKYKLPAYISAIQNEKVSCIELEQPPEREEGLYDTIEMTSGINLWQGKYQKTIIEAALGEKEDTLEDIMKEMNNKWEEARKQIVK